MTAICPEIIYNLDRPPFSATKIIIGRSLGIVNLTLTGSFPKSSLVNLKVFFHLRWLKYNIIEIEMSHQTAISIALVSTISNETGLNLHLIIIYS